MTTDNIVSLGRNADGAVSPRDDAEQMRAALASIDSLREALLSGRIKAFIAVGVAHSHDTFAWSGKRSGFTILEAQGAWAALQGMLPEVM